MSLRDRPYFANSDDLLLGGHVLLALETGRLKMHPADYAEISARLSDIVESMPTSVVIRLRDEGPPALCSIAENALHSRRDAAWASQTQARRFAGAVWGDLLERLRDSAW